MENYRSAIYILVIMNALAGSVSHAAVYRPNGDIIGTISHYSVTKEDNLYEIARRFDIGFVELLAANPGVDPWMPEEGTELTLPTAHILPGVREGLVLNLPELRMFYYDKGGRVMTFPIGIGRTGWQTPLGSTSIIIKRRNPAWIPPASIREENLHLPDIVPSGPDNPLGAFALNLGWQGYAIHGTNKPYGVGRRSSHGCIRLYPEDMEKLFHAIDVGTTVTVIDTSYKLGWQGNLLFLEVMPTQEQADIIAEYYQPPPISIPGIHDAIGKVSRPSTYIDWDAVNEAIHKRNGIPVAIGNGMPTSEKRE